MGISQRIFEIMFKKGLSQKELSQYTKIPTSTISTWKKRNTAPDADYIPLIAEFLGVSIEYLFTGEENSAYNNHLGNDNIVTNSAIGYNATVETTERKDENIEEFQKIIENLTPREKNKLMSMVYDFEENCKKEAK